MTQFEAIVKLTENDAKSIKAYSPAYGWLTIKKVNFTGESSYNKIKCETEGGYVVYFTRDLMLTGAEEHAEQMLFPNIEREDWVVYLDRTQPELKFYVGELIAYEKTTDDAFNYYSGYTLGRIIAIDDHQAFVRIDNIGTCANVFLRKVHKLKEVAKLLSPKLLESKKDVQSIQN